MFYSFKLYLLDRWIMLSVLASWVVYGVLVWFTATRVHPSDSSVFLHYNIIFGTDLVGSWRQQLTPAIVGAVVLAVNGFASWFMYGASRLVGRMLGIFTLAIQISLLVGLVLNLNLNL